MISYEVYKILHIFSLFIVIAATGAIISEGRWIPRRSFKIVVGVLSFLIFVGGMGLIARLGFKHGEPFPSWIMVKIVAWIIFNICLVLLFRFQNKKQKVIFSLLGFLSLFIASFSAITKLV